MFGNGNVQEDKLHRFIEIENYPGQAEVVSGMDLMANWPEQCQKIWIKT